MTFPDTTEVMTDLGVIACTAPEPLGPAGNGAPPRAAAPPPAPDRSYEKTLPEAFAALFGLWRLEVLADDVRHWTIYDFKEHLLAAYFEETGLSSTHGMEFLLRPATVESLRAVNLPCLALVSGGPRGLQYVVFAGFDGDRAVVIEPGGVRNEVPAAAWVSSVRGSLVFLVPKAATPGRSPPGWASLRWGREVRGGTARSRRSGVPGEPGNAEGRQAMTRRLVAAVVLVVAAAGNAHAAEVTPSPVVNATAAVVGVCESFQDGDLSFTIDPSSAGPISARVDRQPKVKCSNQTSFTVAAVSANKGGAPASCAAPGGITGTLRSASSAADTFEYTFTCGTAAGVGAGFGTGRELDLGVGGVGGLVTRSQYAAAVGHTDYQDTVTLVVTY